MQPTKWKSPVSFVEGVATSIIAHVTAWLAILSIAAVCKFLGHVAGDVGLQILAFGP